MGGNKKDNQKQYVIGVDGGGTKTAAALADLKGRVLAYGRSGPANPRNVGIKKSAQNVVRAIKATLKDIDKKSEILSVFIGLPTVQEEFKLKKKIKIELLKQKGISKISKSKIIVDSDQINAFRSGTDERDGVLVIAGTGHVAHGWRQKKEAHASAWGWLADEGSAFWTGHKALQEVFKEIDGRGEKTLITKLLFKKFLLKSRLVLSSEQEFKSREKLLSKIYSANFVEILASLSVLVGEASKRGDQIAKAILFEAGKELILSAKTVIDKLNFRKEKFPLVLVGGMFKSRLLLNHFKKEVKKFAPKVKFIQPKRKPVMGAVKLALQEVYGAI